MGVEAAARSVPVAPLAGVVWQNMADFCSDPPHWDSQRRCLRRQRASVPGEEAAAAAAELCPRAPLSPGSAAHWADRCFHDRRATTTTRRRRMKKEGVGEPPCSSSCCSSSSLPPCPAPPTPTPAPLVDFYDTLGPSIPPPRGLTSASGWESRVKPPATQVPRGATCGGSVCEWRAGVGEEMDSTPSGPFVRPRRGHAAAASAVSANVKANIWSIFLIYLRKNVFCVHTI